MALLVLVLRPVLAAAVAVHPVIPHLMVVAAVGVSVYLVRAQRVLAGFM